MSDPYEEGVLLSPDALTKAIKFCDLARAKKDVRFYLNAIKIELFYAKKAIRVVGTDGSVLSVIEVQDPDWSDIRCPEPDAIAVIDAVNGDIKLMLSFISGADDVVLGIEDNGDLMVHAGKPSDPYFQNKLYLKPLDCKYPDYQRVISSVKADTENILPNRFGMNTRLLGLIDKQQRALKINKNNPVAINYYGPSTGLSVDFDIENDGEIVSAQTILMPSRVSD